MNNRYWSRAVWTCVLGGLAVLSACDDLPSDSALAAPDAARQSAESRRENVRDEEREFFELAAEISGFGGYAFDEQGNLVAHVKKLDKEKETKVRGRLNGVLHGRRGGLKGKHGVVKVKDARFSFPELADWRDDLTDGLLGKGLDVRSTDADEARNRVVVGVGSEAARQAVRRKLVELGVPEEAVEIVQEDAIGYEGQDPGVQASVPGYLSSDDTYDASRGGLPINWVNDGSLPIANYSFSYCTVGFYAYKNGVKVGVSNSHCSRDKNSGGGDGTEYYHRYLDFGSYQQLDQYVGSEVHDRGFHDYCGRWYNPLRWCRHADAMLFSTTGTAKQTAVGFIARPAIINPGGGDDYQYKQINASSPSFRVTARNSTRSGEYVNKVGARTGWTRGSVTATCKDVDMAVLVILPQPVMKCQHETNYGRNGGDSGGPVFVVDAYGNADLRGIHWGHYPQTTGFKTVFSSLGGIERDLGALSVLAPYAPPPPPPFSAAIGGNDWPVASTYQTYTAQVTSGVGPFTYRWYVDGSYVGDGSSYSLWVYDNAFGLDVEVTDSTGETVYGTIWISPRPNCQDVNSPTGGISPQEHYLICPT